MRRRYFGLENPLLSKPLEFRWLMDYFFGGNLRNGCKLMSEIKDSGERRAVFTGAVRDRAVGKGRMDLLPWFALEELAKHYEQGAIKYGKNNYLKGMPVSWFVDSALRHLMKAMRGQTDENHWRAAAWNILGCIEIQRRIELGLLPEELNDLPPILPDEVQKQLE